MALMWWEILNVSPDATTKEIKRAYARLIKEYRPDTHPEEFREIREAFEAAKQDAEYHNHISTPTDFQQAPQIESIDKTKTEQLNNTPPLVKEEDINQSTSDIKNATFVSVDSEIIKTQKNVSELVDSYRGIVLQWEKSGFKDNSHLNSLLTHPGLNQYDSYQEIRFNLFEFICSHVSLSSKLLTTSLNISHRALYRLNQIFNWHDNEIELTQKYDADKVSLIFYGINEAAKNIKWGSNENTEQGKHKQHRIIYLILFIIAVIIPYGIIVPAAYVFYQGVRYFMRQQN